MSTIFNPLRIILFVIATIFLFSNCRKIEIPSKSVSPTINQFFDIPAGSNPVLEKVISVLKEENSRNEFVSKLVKKEGFALWNKAFLNIVQPQTTTNLRTAASNGTDTLIFIPLVLENTNYVNSFLAAKLNGSVSVKLYRGRDYKKYNYAKTAFDTTLTAELIARQIMALHMNAFGDSIFKITDHKLFGYTNDNKSITSRKVYYKRIVPQNNASRLLFYSISVCQEETVENNQGNLVGEGPLYTTGTICTTYSWWEDDGSDVVGYNGTGGYTGSGGSTGDGNDDGDTDPDPLGWEPLNPYESLSIEDKAEIDEIISEENFADKYVFNPTGCKGTARMGNMYFQGTMEHWITQLDFLSRYPLNSDREYSIPGAGSNGGYGFADVVNTATKEIFEIKPFSLTSTGESEVANYVTHANISCPNSGTPGVPWIKGISFGYSPRYLPYPKDPSKSIYVESFKPGVITYSIRPRVSVQSPIVIPQTVVDKIKNLLQRLHQYPGNIEYEIGVFVKDPQNADVLQAIQGALVGSAIAIVIGTIIEDVITAGVGIADDWACFLLAYKLVRVAKVL